MAKLQPFTVVGVYENDGQAFADWAMAETAKQAAAAAEQEHAGTSLKVLCVFPGELSDLLLESDADTEE